MSLRIVRPGFFTTVQDLGRPGFAALGVPPSGAMDALSLRAANLLVGNDQTLAGLEFTLFGPEIAFEQDALVVLTGSEFERSLGEREAPHAAAFAVRAGETLEIGKSREGARGYLAVHGGIEVAKVLDSRSTHVASAFGGHEGRALEAGDRLPVGSRRGQIPLRRLRPGILPSYSSEQCLRVVPGPQADAFSAAGRALFYSSAYRVSSRSDRMGIRLEGPAIEHTAGADIAPEGLAPGAIQIPADGQPILLGADRPTTGGYAKIAAVIGADLGLAAQAKPGDRLRFRAVGIGEARALWREQDAKLLSGIEEMR